MELITEKIGMELEILIQNAFELVKNTINKENKRINHINIYHKDWKKNSYNEIINILNNKYNIEINKIISMGFICSQVNSHNQHFHIDYNGNTETFFIPLIDLDNNNGTEYIEFINKDFNINIFNELLTITDEFINREQIINYFDKLNILHSNYQFKFLNGKKGCMVKMPYYVFHRGQSNKGTQDRIMFQIIIAKNENANVSLSLTINDSELDEDEKTINKLLQNRIINNNLF